MLTFGRRTLKKLVLLFIISFIFSATYFVAPSGSDWNDGSFDAGYHNVIWNGDTHSSGVYFVKMISKEFISTQKLMLVK